MAIEEIDGVEAPTVASGPEEPEKVVAVTTLSHDFTMPATL